MGAEIKPTSVIVANLGLEPYGPAHDYFAERCKFRMQKYTPNSKGDPTKQSNLNDPRIDEQDNLVYEESYASIQYHGIIWGHQVPEDHYTTPGTGPYWDKVMVSVEGQDLLKDMKDYFKGEK